MELTFIKLYAHGKENEYNEKYFAKIKVECPSFEFLF